MGTSHDTSRSRRVLPFSALKISPWPMLVPCIVRVFKRTVFRGSSPGPRLHQWWQASELKQLVQALLQVSAPALHLRAPPIQAAPLAAQPWVCYGAGLTKPSTVAGRWPAKARSASHSGHNLTAEGPVRGFSAHCLLCLSRLCWWNVCVLGCLYVDMYVYMGTCVCFVIADISLCLQCTTIICVLA